MDALTGFKKKLRQGQLFRRADFPSADRYLKQMLEEGSLRKVSPGVYYYPKQSRFGSLPPEEDDLVKTFLKTDNFYVASLNSYNSLGVGATQLYNEKLVYNNRRDGHFTLNGRNYYFMKNRKFPKKPDKAFLMVDMVNNLKLLAEDPEELKHKLALQVRNMDSAVLKKAINKYAGSRTKAFFCNLMNETA